MLRTLLAAATVMITGLLAATPAVAATGHSPARGRVFIHRIYYNSPGPDRGSNSSLNAEWVDLRNSAGHPITLTSWTLRDAAGHIYRFGQFRLRAHQDVRIHTGRGSDNGSNLYWGHRWYIWNNDGDTATLRAGTGSLKSRCSYSDPDEQHASVTC
ncbi:MAG: lamin tail domain-containing protein [Streptosporangiaceae bacterium]